MSKVFIPAGYHSCLSLYDTQKAISLIKRVFEDTLCGNLNLSRVSAPLFVEASTGLNDDLNGVERPVSFDVPDIGRDAQVVHSLAKWKRLALHRYGFRPGKGLYTDMNAIRRDETLDNIHSIYVDQWDWEKVITPEERNVAYLKATVQSIVDAIVSTQRTLRAIYPQLNTVPDLVPEVTFITTQELEDRYPELTPKERENAITRECGTVFLMQIGGKLRSGQPFFRSGNRASRIRVVTIPTSGRRSKTASMAFRDCSENTTSGFAIRTWVAPCSAPQRTPRLLPEP